MMSKPLAVRRSLNAQGLGKPEMVPCSKFYSDGHAWVVDRQGPVEHRANCGARIICEIISNGIWVGHATSDDEVRIPALEPFNAAKTDPKIGRESGRERECQYGSITVVAVYLKNKISA